MNVGINEQIAPEIVQAIIAQARERGLSVNDYLRNLLGLENGEGREFALSQVSQPTDEERPPHNEAMFAALQRSAERLKDMPVRGSTQETLKMIRRARAGEMWGEMTPEQEAAFEREWAEIYEANEDKND